MAKKKENPPVEEKKTGEAEKAANTAAENEIPESVTLTRDEFKQVKERIDQLEKEKESDVALLQRLQADFDNYRRRNASIAADSLDEGERNLIKALLPVLDNFDRALAAVPEDEKTAWVDGMKLVSKQLYETLYKAGLEEIQAEGQFDLFADLDDSKENDSAMGDAMVQVPDVEEWDKKTKLNFEREMLGLYVSDHPLSGMQSILVSLREMSIAHLIDRAGSMPDGQQVTIAGLITNVDRRVSKKGNPWAIVTVEDLESSIQCMFFGKVYEAAAPELAVDTVVQIRGQVEKRDETVSMRATEFTVPTLEAQDERPLTIVLPPIALDQSHVRRLGQILTSHPGPCEVKLALMDDKGNAKVLTFGDRFRVKRDTSLFAEIKILFGPSSLPLA